MRIALCLNLDDTCWAKFYESGLSGCVELSADANECASGLHSEPQLWRRPACPASTVLSFDNDGDGDKDLLLGDISWPNFVLVENGGDKEKAWGTSQDCSFPSYNIPANIISNYPAGFYLDVNNDGSRDLIAAPNQKNNSLDIAQCMGIIKIPELMPILPLNCCSAICLKRI